MNVLALSPLGRMAGFGLLAAWVILGIIMTAHGFQKLTQMGAGAFGELDLALIADFQVVLFAGPGALSLD
jgi:uncharacterized membrane protein YphA (DoxX/SURF4 family)